MDASVVVQGFVAGCLYALAGISLNMLYRPTNTFNFAQGDLIMVGAMVCAALLKPCRLSGRTSGGHLPTILLPCRWPLPGM